MGAFVKTTKVCAVAALGLGLSLGIAVSADPSTAIAAAAPASQATSSSIIVTSPTEIDEKTPVEIAGTARPGSTLQLFGLPGEFVTPVEVSDDGTFSHRSERGFVAGVHTVTVSSGYLDSVVLDMRVRGADGTVPALIPLTVDEPTYVPGQRLVLSGRATPGASILVTAPSASLGSTDVTVRDDGTWSFVSTLPVRGTEHEVKVRQSGPAGTDYKIFTITADEPSFKPLTVDAPSYVPGQKVRLSGTATPNGAINILGNSAGISENLTADADGKWSFESRHAVAGLQHQVRVRQTAANDAGTLVALQASDENGEKPVFRPLAVTSDTSYVPGGTTRVTGTATSWSQVRVALSNPGGKPVPGANVWTHTVMAGADGAWSVEIPNHRLISAKVQQYGELGNGTVSFDFTR